MNTSVKVSAHCSADKEVIVSVTGETDVAVQDGQECEVFVYDERIVSVREVVKAAQQDSQEGGVAQDSQEGGEAQDSQEGGQQA